MSILKLNFGITGQVNVNPRIIKMITTDDIETITRENYLNITNLQGNIIVPTDYFRIIYDFDQENNTWAFGNFYVRVSNGNISLFNDPFFTIDGVVNAGNFCLFSGTAGAIKDNLNSPSDVDGVIVSIVSKTVTPGYFARFSDNVGSLEDGYLPTHTGTNLVSSINYNIPFTVGNLPIFTDNAGTIGDSGIKILSGGFRISGSSTTQIFNVPGMNPSYCGSTFSASSIDLFVQSAVPGNDILTVKYNTNPTSSFLSYIYASAQI